MQIGELSRRSGISVRMLRYYEKERLLRPSRKNSGYREYGPAEERLAQRIRMFRDAGLKVEAIRTLLPCVLNDRPVLELCDKVRTTLTREMGEIEKRINSLKSSHHVLASYLRQDTKRAFRRD